MSKVKKTLLPEDYSGIDPVTLEVARLRGIFVDTYFSEWMTDPTGVLNLTDAYIIMAEQFPREREKNAEDTIHRIEMLLKWWLNMGMKAAAVQQIVYSETDGIAGTFDLATEDLILDLKCVSKLQPNYGLQLGAYSVMDPQAFPLRDVGIIHVTKDKVKLVKYKTRQCRDQWKACLGWYKTLSELNV